MIDLDELKDRIYEALKCDSSMLHLDLVCLINEVRQFREHAKACCCDSGEMLVEDKQFTSSFDEPDPDGYPFAKIGYAICNVCHGANVMVKLNERQRQMLERLQLSLSNQERDYRELELMYERAIGRVQK